jgi:Xaa-Pro aminopeptidase
MTTPSSDNGPALSAPSFSIAERDRRYAAVRMLMRQRSLDCLLIPHNTGEWDNYQSDTRYLTCIGGGGAATSLVFPAEGEPIAVVREGRRVDWWKSQQGWVSDVRAPKNFSWAGVFEDALRELGLTAGRIGVVGLKDVLRDAEGTAAYGEIAALQSAFPKLRIESAIDVLNVVRKRKSAEEIAVMRGAQACADAVSEALRATAKPGATEHEVYAALVAAHIRTGGETPTMILFGADPHMWQTHLLPRFRRVAADDVIVIEAETKFCGYIAQSVETAAMRPFSRSEQLLLDVSQICFDAILAAMKPGVAYADLIALWEKTATGAGHQPGRTMGHGLGLGQDRPLTTRGGNAGEAIVEEGDCFVLKPWVEDGAGKISARVGANVVVESLGAVRLKRAVIRQTYAQESAGRAG